MGAPFPTITPSYRGVGPHLTHDSLGPSKATTQTASGSVLPFLHRWPHSVHILYNGTPLPFMISHYHKGSGPDLIHGFLGHPSPNPNGISIGSAVLYGSLVWQTDRPTDQATRSVAIDHIYVGYVVLRCGLKVGRTISRVEWAKGCGSHFSLGIEWGEKKNI